MRVLLNLGNGTFAPAIEVAVQFEPQSIAAADLNADGRIDLVNPNELSGFENVSVLLNMCLP